MIPLGSTKPGKTAPWNIISTQAMVRLVDIYEARAVPWGTTGDWQTKATVLNMSSAIISYCLLSPRPRVCSARPYTQDYVRDQDLHCQCHVNPTRRIGGKRIVEYVG